MSLDAKTEGLLNVYESLFLQEGTLGKLLENHSWGIVERERISSIKRRIKRLRRDIYRVATLRRLDAKFCRTGNLNPLQCSEWEGGEQ